MFSGVDILLQSMTVGQTYFITRLKCKETDARYAVTGRELQAWSVVEIFQASDVGAVSPSSKEPIVVSSLSNVDIGALVSVHGYVRSVERIENRINGILVEFPGSNDEEHVAADGVEAVNGVAFTVWDDSVACLGEELGL